MAAENGATWVGAKFYTPGRESTVQLIVLHWMATSMAGADATFTGGVRQASAHFGLEDSKRHQYVHKADTAWHANDHVINHKSIGIEHSAQPGRDATEATIFNSIALCTDLCREFGLTADAIHKHNDYSATQCPGTLPVARIREAVRANLTAAAPAVGDDMPDPKDLWDYEITGPDGKFAATAGAWLAYANDKAGKAARDAASALAVVKALAAKPTGLSSAEIEAAAKAGAKAALDEEITSATVVLNTTHTP